MRLVDKNSFSNNNLVKLKGQDWLDKQRVAGKLAARTLLKLEGLVKSETDLTYTDLNEVAEKFIADGGGIPTFKNYKGFPAGVCISVNKQLVHGIPTNTKLQDGDIISFDLGVTYEGAIADTALTCHCGIPKTHKYTDLINATEMALMKGIESISVGKRLGCIGHSIYKYARGQGYGVITNYGGHGLDWDTPHAPPFVANKGDTNEGIRITSGLAIAIEPMLVIGSINTYVASDGWTVMTNDIGAHFEHSVFVHDDHVEIITDRRGLVDDPTN